MFGLCSRQCSRQALRYTQEPVTTGRCRLTVEITSLKVQNLYATITLSGMCQGCLEMGGSPIMIWLWGRGTMILLPLWNHAQEKKPSFRGLRKTCLPSPSKG